jgi:VWFA-related protein
MTALRPGWISLLAALLLAQALAPTRPALAADPLLVINQVLLDRFPEVAVYFTAVDSTGLPIADVSKDRVQVVHNGRPVPDLTLELAESEQEGLAAVVAVDTSGSMQGQPLDYARAAVRLFLERMGPRDRGAIISFGQTVQLVQDLTGDRDALSRALGGLAAGGDTALYDGAFQAITLVGRQPLGRRAVVVITDGEDTHSSVTLDDVIVKARETSTPVSVIAIGDVKLEPIQRLALVTGGSLSVAPDPDHLSERASQVSELLRKQYVLRYRAPDSRPPENEVELVVSQGGRQIRTAQRFPAPPLPPLSVGLAEPAPGSTVRGLVELRPTLANATRLDRLEYQLDGATFQAVAEPPYVSQWDTSTVPPGEHVLTVRARLGDQEAQQSVPLRVVPAVQLSIELPAGQDVSGRVKLLAELDAAAPVAGVAWAVDGQPIGSSPQPPYEIEWDSGGVPAGEHVVTAEARDERGGVGRASQTVRVVPIGPAGGPTAATGPTAAPGTPGGTATVGSAATATPAATRAATSTPTGSGASGVLGQVPPALLIGLAALIAIVGALMFVASHRRPETVASRASRAALPGGRSWSAAPPGPADPAWDDARMAETEQVTVLPADPVNRFGVPGRASLTVTAPGAPPRSWTLGQDQIIGRAAGPGVIVVADPRVSRRHARITWEGRHFAYRDLGPLNPTRLDGRTLPNPYLLRDGDRLRIGQSELTFRA